MNKNKCTPFPLVRFKRMQLNT